MVKNNAETNAIAHYWWMLLIQGGATILMGWLLLSSPITTIIALVLFLGLYWLVTGIVDVIFAILDAVNGVDHWGWKLFGGVVGIIAGLFIINNQAFATIYTPIIFAYVIAFAFIINGVVTMVIGSQTREEGTYEWSWANFFLGLFYFLFGFILLTSPTIVTVSSLVFASGILMLVGGVMLVILSFRVKSESKKAAA